MKKITTIAGTRPEIIKLSSLISGLDENYPNHEFLYTGQHYSPEMKSIFFKELNVRLPDCDLSVNSSDTEKLAESVYSHLKEEEDKPHYVIVYGDTNSTLAGAKAAKAVGSKLIHLEAGLRSFDMGMPEERNRILVDKMSAYHFPPTDLSRLFLTYEGYPQENIFVTGNLVVDACQTYLPEALKKVSCEKPSLLMTLHRQENVDNPTTLRKFVNALSKVEEPIVFPIHPRTRKSLKENKIELPGNIVPIDPLGYLDFIGKLYHSSLVLTDSGGVQEEAITLKKPCITMRKNTERWETVLLGANVLYDIDSDVELKPLVDEMKSRTDMISRIKNPYGEKGVTTRMLEAIRFIAEKQGSNN